METNIILFLFCVTTLVTFVLFVTIRNQLNKIPEQINTQNCKKTFEVDTVHTVDVTSSKPIYKFSLEVSLESKETKLIIGEDTITIPPPDKKGRNTKINLSP